MEYFLKFLESKEHLPYVATSYIIVFFILVIIFVHSILKLKKLENDFDELNKQWKKKIKEYLL